MKRVENWLRHYWSLAVLLIGLIAAMSYAFYHFAVDESTFLAIFIPAAVGVIGSYGLYLKRRVDKLRRLRKALRSELEGMEWFKLWPSGDSHIPPYNPVPSTVYEQNADSLGMLTDKEITHITEFYSRAETTREILGYHGTRMIEANSNLLGQDMDKGKREDALMKILDRLSLSYQRALLTMLQQLEQPGQSVFELTSGDVVDDGHPFLLERPVLCLDYGLFEEDGEQYRVTKKGEAFFEGELSAADLDKENDILARDEHWGERIYRRFIGTESDSK